jgi:hypothetical protein
MHSMKKYHYNSIFACLYEIIPIHLSFKDEQLDWEKTGGKIWSPVGRNLNGAPQSVSALSPLLPPHVTYYMACHQNSSDFHLRPLPSVDLFKRAFPFVLITAGLTLALTLCFEACIVRALQKH